MLKFMRFVASQNYSQTHIWVVCWDDSKNREVEYLAEQSSVRIENNKINFKTDESEYTAHMFYI